MPSPYQEFVRQARERFRASKKKTTEKPATDIRSGVYSFTVHAQHKMRQYGLSAQKVRWVIRAPKRREEGIVPRTIVMMRPVSPKVVDGKEIWKQEVWAMLQEGQIISSEQSDWKTALPVGLEELQTKNIKIISVWRYPGMSPKNHSIPEEILREMEERSILEEGGIS